MEYIKSKSLVIMDLIDLEHCGFNHNDFDFELRVSGIEDPEAKWPAAMVVNFSGGAVVTANTTKETTLKMREMREKFNALLAKI